MSCRRIIGAALAAFLSLAPAEADVIGSGHVMGNGTSGARTPTDTSLDTIMGQPGSGIGTGVAALLAGTSTGTGGPIGSVNGTFTNFNVGAGTTSSGTFVSAVPTSGGVFGVPAFYFNDVTNPVGTTDAATHFAMGVVGNTPATGSGAYEALFVQQFGSGRDSGSYITAFQATAEDELGGTGGGNFGGSNPQCLNNYIVMTSCTGEEIDISTAFAPTNYREGVRIADLGSAAGTYGVGSSDAAIGIVAAGGAAGFKYGLSFGESNTGALPPIASGGVYITTGISAVSHAAALDTRGTPNWSIAPIVSSYGVPLAVENFGGTGQIGLIGTTGTGNVICIGCNGAFPLQTGGALAVDGNEIAIGKGTPAAAPGAGFLAMYVIAGSGSSCSLVAYAGTSATPVTIAANVGSGC